MANKQMLASLATSLMAEKHELKPSATLSRCVCPNVGKSQVAPGRYRAEGLLFHMIGHWAIHVDVASGARIERAQLDVELEL